MLIVQRCPTERVDVIAGSRLAEGQLSGRGASGEGLRLGAAAISHERAQVRQAHTTLARADAGETRPLHQLELVEALLPHTIEVFNGDLAARADHTLARAGRQGVSRRRWADHGDRHHRRHACEQIAWRRTEIDGDAVTFDHRAIGELDRADPFDTVDGHEVATYVGETAEIDTSGQQYGGSPWCVETGKHVAGTHRVNLGRAGGQGDVVCMQLVDPVGRAHHDGRTVEHTDHLVALDGIEHQHVGTVRARDRRSRCAAGAVADHDVVG